MNWSELVVHLQPLSRKIEELLSRREYLDAMRAMQELCDIAQHLHSISASEYLHSMTWRR